MGRKVRRQHVAAVVEILRHVVQGVVGGHIICVPAGGAQGAGPADLVGYPVEHCGHIFIVDRCGSGTAQAVIEVAEDRSGAPQLLFQGFRRTEGGSFAPAALLEQFFRQQKEKHAGDGGFQQGIYRRLSTAPE